MDRGDNSVLFYLKEVFIFEQLFFRDITKHKGSPFTHALSLAACLLKVLPADRYYDASCSVCRSVNLITACLAWSHSSFSYRVTKSVYVAIHIFFDYLCGIHILIGKDGTIKLLSLF